MSIYFHEIDPPKWNQRIKEVKIPTRNVTPICVPNVSTLKEHDFMTPSLHSAYFHQVLL